MSTPLDEPYEDDPAQDLPPHWSDKDYDLRADWKHDADQQWAAYQDYDPDWLDDFDQTPTAQPTPARQTEPDTQTLNPQLGQQLDQAVQENIVPTIDDFLTSYAGAGNLWLDGTTITSQETGTWQVQTGIIKTWQPPFGGHPEPYIEIGLKNQDGTIIRVTKWADNNFWCVDAMTGPDGQPIFSHSPGGILEGKTQTLNTNLAQHLETAIQKNADTIAIHEAEFQQAYLSYPYEVTDGGIPEEAGIPLHITHHRPADIAACQEGLGTGTAMGHPSPQPAQTTPNIQPTPQPQLTI